MGDLCPVQMCPETHLQPFLASPRHGTQEPLIPARPQPGKKYQSIGLGGAQTVGEGVLGATFALLLTRTSPLVLVLGLKVVVWLNHEDSWEIWIN